APVLVQLLRPAAVGPAVVRLGVAPKRQDQLGDRRPRGARAGIRAEVVRGRPPVAGGPLGNGAVVGSADRRRRGRVGGRPSAEVDVGAAEADDAATAGLVAGELGNDGTAGHGCGSPGLPPYSTEGSGCRAAPSYAGRVR